MANRALFGGHKASSNVPTLPTDPKTGTVTRNEAGGAAFHFDPEHALAQYAVTGTFNNTFYTKAETQLEKLKELLPQVSVEYVARLAVFARTKGHMKDMPAILVAWLFYVAGLTAHPAALEAQHLFRVVFPLVIDNGKMLRNFVQFTMRANVWGRKSLGTLGRKAIASWFNARTPEQIFRQSVGTNPSLKDVLALAHVVPKTPEYAALYAYLSDFDFDAAPKVPKKRPMWKALPAKENLPVVVQEFETFKLARENVSKVRAQMNSCVTQLGGLLEAKGLTPDFTRVGPMLEVELQRLEAMEPPRLPFELLTSLPLTEKDWKHIALSSGGWQFVIKNLNTFERHGVFKDPEVVTQLATRIRDAEAIRKAHAFPYQVFAAYINAGENLPRELQDALHDAVEVATQNVPSLPGNVYIFVDVSGSMQMAVTGERKGATSKMTVIDVAALFGVSVLRTSPKARLVPVDTEVHTHCKLEPRDSILTNAKKLKEFGGGGTRLDAALTMLNKGGQPVDTVIFFSDNESWMSETRMVSYLGETTAMASEWAALKRRNKDAKLVCVDVQPHAHTQMPDRKDVLNIGGFSDAIWPVIEAFVNGKDADFWVNTIKKTEI